MENRMFAYFKERTDLVQQRLKEVRAKVAMDREAHSEAWGDALRSVLEQALEKGAALQVAGSKRAIAYLCISFLRTSLVRGKFELRVDLYDEDMYLDEAECAVYWNAAALYPYFEADVAYFTDCARQGLVRLLAAELDGFRLEYGDAYFELLGELCAEAVVDLETWESWQRLLRAKLVRITYGEYMDEGVLLRNVGAEGEEV